MYYFYNISLPRRYKRYGFFIFIVFFSSCAPVRVVQTLPKGKTYVSAGLGGPLIAYSNTTIPIPLTSVSAAYGIRDGLTGFAGLHTTALAFGILQTDLGITSRLVQPNKYIPGISVSPIANLMLDRWQGYFKFYPEMDVNAYWNYGKNLTGSEQGRNCLYIGMFNWFELARKRAFDIDQQHHWLPGFSLGNIFGRLKMSYTIEMKYIAPDISNKDIVVDYKSFGNTGAIGVYFGITRKF